MRNSWRGGVRRQVGRRVAAQLLVVISALSVLAVVQAGSASASEGIVCSSMTSSGGVKAQECIQKSGSTVYAATHFTAKTSACVVQQVLWKKTSSGSTKLASGAVHACSLSAAGTAGPSYQTTSPLDYYATARVYPQGTSHHETSFLLQTDAHAVGTPPGFPTSCNEFMNYGQYLWFFACSPDQGRTIQLLSFGGEWQTVCVRDQYTARWDRGGYAGYRLGSPEQCSWENSAPRNRQPGS